MKKIAAIFPGQGSQSVGMGKDFYNDNSFIRDLFAVADDALKFSLTDLCFNGPEERLKETQFTQPAILTVSVAAFQLLERAGITVSMGGGHSLGEFSALVAADVLDFAEAVQMVHQRGLLMQAAVPLGVGGMSAVMGLDREKIEELCVLSGEQGIVQAVNFNCPGQIVVAGEKVALEYFGKLATEAGAKKVIPLPVSAPFHSKLLQPAAEKFEEIINSIEFRNAKFPVTSNVTGTLLQDAKEIKDNLKQQLCSSVEWENCVSSMMGNGAEYFLELGPGKVLSGFSKRIAKDIPTGNIESTETLAKTLEVLGG